MPAAPPSEPVRQHRSTSPVVVQVGDKRPKYQVPVGTALMKFVRQPSDTASEPVNVGFPPFTTIV